MKYHIIGLVQDCSFSYANELEILQSYTKPSLSIVGYRLILELGGRLNKKDGLTRYGNSHVKDKTS